MLLLALTFFFSPTQLYSKHESFITIVYCHYSCFGVAFANSFSLSPLQQLKDELAGKVSQKQILDMERIWINYQRQNGLETILKEFNQFKSQFQYSLATQDKSESTYSIEVSKASPELLGFDTVKQYTGYFNVNDKDKNYFFWF